MFFWELSLLAGSVSIARIGKYSLVIRPSHSTTALALLVVMRWTTPRRPLGDFFERGCDACDELYLVPSFDHPESLPWLPAIAQSVP